MIISSHDFFKSVLSKVWLEPSDQNDLIPKIEKIVWIDEKLMKITENRIHFTAHLILTKLNLVLLLHLQNNNNNHKAMKFVSGNYYRSA